MNDVYNTVIARLKQGGIAQPGLEARIILKEILGASDADLIAGTMAEPETGQRSRLDDVLDRRLRGEPLSRILGYREFWGLRFALSPDTLDPRPDTEMLVETALKRFAGNPPRRILDIGTGTGCILIALLHEWPEATGIGTDLSTAALETARQNAKANGVANRAAFVQACWASGIDGKFDLILSNPPYINSDVVTTLAPEVKNHDPILALDGGEDGLNAYREIITETKRLLSPSGIALYEIGYDQGDSVSRLVADAGATPAAVIPDYGGNPRVVEWGLGISKKTIEPDS